MKVPSAIRVLGLLLLGSSLLSGPAAAHPVATSPAGPPTWHDNDLVFDVGIKGTDPNPYPACLDQAQPTTLFHYEGGIGTVAYNWADGTSHVLTRLPVNLCGPNGWLFRDYNGQ